MASEAKKPLGESIFLLSTLIIDISGLHLQQYLYCMICYIPHYSNERLFEIVRSIFRYIPFVLNKSLTLRMDSINVGILYILTCAYSC